MKHILAIIIGLGFSILSYTQSLTLQVVSTAGNTEYTVGETFITTSTSSKVILTEGFQQVNLYAVITSVNLASKVDVNVYPNPVTDLLTLSVNSDKKWQVTLFDINGRIVLEKKFIGNTQIDFSSFVPGSFILKMNDEYSSVTYNIIKR